MNSIFWLGCKRRLVTILAFAAAAILVGTSPEQSGAATADVSSQVRGIPSDARRVVLSGHMQPNAVPRLDAGAVPATLPMAELKFVLQRSTAQQESLKTLLDAQQTPASPQYHKWLTPAQFGTQFGASDHDLQTVRTWLESHSFKVGDVPAGRNVLPFSGTAAQVEAAFQTPIHYFTVNGVTHFANTVNPQIPAAFQPLITGIRGLHDFHAKSDAKVRTVANPNLLSGGGNYVGPLDFVTIYNFGPLFLNGTRGDGVTVAVASQSDIDLTIPKNYWAAFGVTQLQQVTSVAAAAATDPGRTGDSDETEAYLDVEIIGALAPDAKIVLVRDTDVGTAFEYAINHNLAGVINISFSTCEQSLGSANASVVSAYQQAVAQGITVVVSTGDNGIAECEDATANTEGKTVVTGLSVNGFASTPYNTAVGGTDFNPLLVPQGNYWATTNSAQFFSNAESYIPEMVWNDTCANSAITSVYNDASPLALCNDPNHTSSLLRIDGSGGGVSSCITMSASGACGGGYAVPSWQSGVVGIQGLTARAIPDVSYLADDWVACDQQINPCAATGHAIEVFSGTSVAAPAMAAMVALLNEVSVTKTNADGRLGNINPLLYKMAAQQYGSQASPNNTLLIECNANNGASIPNGCAFNDITAGGNAQPCQVSGYAAANSRPLSTCASAAGDNFGIVDVASSSSVAYNAAPGYDLASGLGSINGTTLVEWVTGQSAPLNLIATASGTSANLSWTPIVGATSYNVYYGTSAGNESSIPLLNAVTNNATVVPNLQPGQIYYFAVTGNTSSGQTLPSSEQAVVLVPATPTGVAATGAATSIVLTWSASAGAASYSVLEGSTAGGESSTPIATGLTSTSYTASGTSGKTAYFKIVAVNQGGSSTASSEITATVLPVAPTALAATAGNASVTLSWTAGAGATSYSVYEGNGAGMEGATALLANITGTMATVPGLTNASLYSFYVRSVNSTGSSEPSNEVTATPNAAASSGKSGGGSVGFIDLLLGCVLLLGRAAWPSARRA